MNRRSFLARAVTTLPLFSLAPLLDARAADAPRDTGWRVDLVIAGGGLGGCAAALAACRAGLKVVLTEPTDWIGGQVTAQAVPPDEHPWIESFGCTRSYREYRDAVRAYYRRHYPLTAAALANPGLNPGNGWVSRLCHEPRVSLAVIEAMLAPYVSARRLRILLEHEPISAETDADRVRAITVRDLRTGETRVLAAPYFIDATELGDLLALTGTEHVTGAESREETGEPHAADKARPASQQAITACFALDYLEGEDHTIERPAEYDFWRGYVPDLRPAWAGPLLRWETTHPVTLKPRRMVFDPMLKATGANLWTYRQILDAANFNAGAYSSSISLINWPQNDYWLGPLVGVSPADAARHGQRARQLSLSLLYWMQTEAPRPDGGAGWKGLRLRHDIVDTRDGLAKHPYIREARRIRAEFTVKEQHVSADIRAQATGRNREDVSAEPFPDSVGVGAYRIDLHPSTAGDNYIDLSSLPFQIPLASLLPRRVENLLPAAKNIGSTHITNGAFRLHPVEWNIGESAGALVAFCLREKEPPRQVRRDSKRLAAFQQLLRNAGVELEWPRVRPL
jgi:hypothetical protein